MLTALSLGNFKAFGEAQRLPIRPLTLIFGANSSGKSSLIHGLLFGRQAVDAGDLDVQRTEIGGDSVDLGGFRQYVHRRDPFQQVEWGVRLDASRFSGRLAELMAAVQRVDCSLTIGITVDNRGQPTRDAAPEVRSYRIEGDGELLVAMSRRRGGAFRIDRLDHRHPVFRAVLRALVESATTARELTTGDYAGLDETVDRLVPQLSVQTGGFLPAGLARPEPFLGAAGAGGLVPIRRGQRAADLAGAVEIFLPRALDELIGGLSDSVTAELRRLRYLGPLRSYPPRHLAFTQHHDSNWLAGGGYAWDTLRRDATVRAAVNEWLGAEWLKTPYELRLQELINIDDLDAPLLNALATMNEETIGPMLASFKNLALDASSETEEEEDDEPDDDLDIGLEVERIKGWIRSADIDRIQELVLVDQRSGTEVSHRDVGIGISQVLPVLVGAFAERNSIVAIEQPEIHLHPALQAELGDVFIRSALGELQNTFILETHSEHLILRIMRRIRDTVDERLPEGLPPVHPRDVAILYVQPEGSASVVRELRLDEEGQFLDPWPDGFFEEGFRERFS
ncbi:MAG: DUF3696 domain-containing protein [Dehalococcoidia bacterium]